MSIPPFSIKSTFVDSIRNLDITKQAIEYDLLIIQDEIKSLRKLHYSLLSNFSVNLYNDLISLYYRIKLHADNCKIYLDVMEDLDSIDHSFHLQLSGILDMSKELTNEFLFLQKRSNSSTSKKRVINA